MPGQDEFMHQLEASLIFLNYDTKPELLVQGPLGANVTTFRLYRHINGRWDEVLNTVAHDLLIERRVTNGYHNIATACMTAVTLSEATFKFNGRRYSPHNCTVMEMGNPKAHKRHVPCGH